MPYRPIVGIHPPERPNQGIWRYLDLSRFLYILEYRKLPFVRLDKMSDYFEGAPPVHAIALSQRQHPNVVGTPTEWAALGTAAYAVNQNRGYVSCWNQGNSESAALWEIYGNKGIAIRSTYSRLISAIADEPREIYIGTVSYQNNVPVAGALGDPRPHAFRKRTYFKHESELRALTYDHPESTFKPDGSVQQGPVAVEVEVDLKKLVQEIYYSPHLSSWQQRLMRDLPRRYGLDVPVLSPFLDKRPVY